MHASLRLTIVRPRLCPLLCASLRYSASLPLRASTSQFHTSQQTNLKDLPTLKSANSDPLEHILNSNREWAAATHGSDSSFLPTLSKGQAPKILWIGCSDSRVPETTILGLKPGDVFVHRNIANVLTCTDLSSLSVIEYAVKYLKVQHVVLCGHTSCGGVAGALANKKLGKIDTWLMPIRALRMKHAKELEQLPENERAARLVELNVEAGVEVLRENPDILEAKKERGLDVHGMVYDLAKGELFRLECGDFDEPARLDAFSVE